MITFITALYSEAKELIIKLNLKKSTTETMYQLFEGNDICLIVTGCGEIQASINIARHFALHPAKNNWDMAINLGLAGYTSGIGATVSNSQPQIGDLFLVSKITQQHTGRTFYPDLIYKNSYRKLPLTTCPNVTTSPSAFTDETLVDMEGAAVYQALLPHISPERILFLKIVSDILSNEHPKSIQSEQLIASNLEEILTYALTLHQFLKQTSYQDRPFDEQETALIQSFKETVPMTETMELDFHRLLNYARLSGIPFTDSISHLLSTLEGTTIRGKKQAMPYLARLRNDLLNQVPASFSESFPTGFSVKEVSNHVFYPSFFSTVYAEKEVWNDFWQKKLQTSPILIDHYKDIFNRSHQNFNEQKKAPALILAKKTGTLIYQGAPVCQSFGNQHFYYTSCMMNCIYHCDYCYLQGMYPSGHVVVFVNLEDYFSELETLLSKHPVYLCISYDTDLLALEQRFSFVSRWLSFASAHSDLTLEIRTKSGNPSVFESLSALYSGNEQLKQQIIFAWTVSPDTLCSSIEHGASSLSLRIKSLIAAKEAGFSVRLCFDPMIFHAGWQKTYAELVTRVFSEISPDILFDVSIGVFRISTEYLKNMKKKRPDSAIVQYPYMTENGVSHYGTLSEKMVQYLYQLLLPYVPAEKIFVWNGGLN